MPASDAASIRLRARQRVAGPRHEAQRLVAQRLDVEFGALRVGGQLPDRDVERALPQRGGQHVARVDQHEDLEARPALPDRLQRGRDEPGTAPVTEPMRSLPLAPRASAAISSRASDRSVSTPRA